MAAMTRSAKPADFQRLAVVVVMSFRLAVFAASGACVRADKFTGIDCVSSFVVSNAALRVLAFSLG
jgi:hypothetical protein